MEFLTRRFLRKCKAKYNECWGKSHQYWTKTSRTHQSWFGNIYPSQIYYISLMFLFSWFWSQITMFIIYIFQWTLYNKSRYEVLLNRPLISGVNVTMAACVFEAIFNYTSTLRVILQEMAENIEVRNVWMGISCLTFN